MKKINLKIIRYSITVLLLLSLLYIADVKSIISHLYKANLAIYGIATLTFLTIYLWSALRWKSLISGLGYSISFSESFKTIAMSYGFNKIFPMNAGDLTRSKLMERYTDIDSHGKILGAVAMERFLDILLLGTVTSISAFYLLESTGDLKWLLSAVLILIILMTSIRVKNKFFVKIIDSTQLIGIPERLTEFIKDGLRGYNEIPRFKLIEVLLWHSLRWFSGILVLYILAQSLGSPISLAAAALVTGVMSMIAALPITPAGLGPVEALGTGSLVILGLSTSQAGALVILQRSLGFILMGVIGALVYSID